MGALVVAVGAVVVAWDARDDDELLLEQPVASEKASKQTTESRDVGLKRMTMTSKHSQGVAADSFPLVPQMVEATEEAWVIQAGSAHNSRLTADSHFGRSSQAPAVERNANESAGTILWSCT